MSHKADYLTSSAASEFEHAKKCLLPNEDVRFVSEIERGFFVISNRRAVFMEETKVQTYHIRKVIPLDCFLGVESKKSDRVRVAGIALDKYGCFDLEPKSGTIQWKTHSLNLKAPKAKKGENKAEIRRHFQAAMSNCFEVVKEVRGAEEFTSDTSYLENMPESLTRNAILDINTISEDWPIHDELHQKVLKFLGTQPFLLEESLRAGEDKENGILFAAGEQGYIWIEGIKKGRFMSNVLLDKVEWDNIKCFAHRWQNENAVIEVTYAIHRDGVELTMPHQWSPTANEDVFQYPWLLQPLNGPWILADIMYKWSGKHMHASWVREMHLEPPELHKQRYYY